LYGYLRRRKKEGVLVLSEKRRDGEKDKGERGKGGKNKTGK